MTTATPARLMLAPEPPDARDIAYGRARNLRIMDLRVRLDAVLTARDTLRAALLRELWETCQTVWSEFPGADNEAALLITVRNCRRLGTIWEAGDAEFAARLAEIKRALAAVDAPVPVFAP
mgnify:FL=1